MQMANFVLIVILEILFIAFLFYLVHFLICRKKEWKRVYISGPITGTEDYMERFAAAEKHLTECGYKVVNPAKIGAQMPPDTTYEGYMSMSLRELDRCEKICMLPGWEKSLGANREYGYALARKMPILRVYRNEIGRISHG